MAQKSRGWRLAQLGEPLPMNPRSEFEYRRQIGEDVFLGRGNLSRNLNFSNSIAIKYTITPFTGDKQKANFNSLNWAKGTMSQNK